ncbi:MAG: L-lactate dehydrogenase [bacterium]|nr:L-lactate dehydrogenase [bacterium]
MNSQRKVVIVGAGAVGATFAYALAQSGLAEEIVLVDRNEGLALGQALDLAHGYPFFPPVVIRAGTSADYADAQVIVIAAGAKQNPGESRLNLLQRNALIVRSIMHELVAQAAQGIVIMVSNPVDVLTRVALDVTGWPARRIIGSGTVLDSARFRYLLSQHCGVDVRNVHAYIIGEHGDSEVAAWSMTHIAGVPIDTYCNACRKCARWAEEREAIVRAVRESAYHIIGYKGATHFGVGMALVRIVEAILRNERSVLTVSTRLHGEYGLRDVCLSVPVIVAREGVERVIEGPLRDEELAGLRASAELLEKAYAELALPGEDVKAHSTPRG